MSRMKTFLMYLIFVVLLYIYSNIMIKIGLDRVKNEETQPVNNSIEVSNLRKIK